MPRNVTFDFSQFALRRCIEPSRAELLSVVVHTHRLLSVEIIAKTSSYIASR